MAMAVAGLAWGQDIDCVVIEGDAEAGAEITITVYDEEGEQIDLSGEDGAELCFGDAGDCIYSVPPGEGEAVDTSSGSIVFTLAEYMLDATVFDVWTWPLESWYGITYFSDYETVEEAIAGGGTCEGMEPQEPPEAIDVGDVAMPLGTGMYQLNVPFFLDVDEDNSNWGFVGLHNNLDTQLEIGVIYFNSEGDQLRFDANVSPYNTAVIPAYASVAYRPVGDLPAALPQTIANRPQHVDAVADGIADSKNNGAIVIMWDDGDEGALQGRYLQVNGNDSSAYLLPAGVEVQVAK